MLKIFTLLSKKEKSELASVIKTHQKDAQHLRSSMDTFASSDSTLGNSKSIGLLKQAYLAHRDQTAIPKRDSCSSIATTFSLTPTLVDHEDEHILPAHVFDGEKDDPECKLPIEFRSLFRSPSLPTLQQPFATRMRPTITFSSGVVVEPMYPEVIRPKPETARPQTSGLSIENTAARPKSEQYTSNEWYPASSLRLQRGPSHDEDTPLVNNESTSETRTLHRSTARRLPNGPNSWIPPAKHSPRMRV